jgi:hypothetical protein
VWAMLNEIRYGDERYGELEEPTADDVGRLS